MDPVGSQRQEQRASALRQAGLYLPALQASPLVTVPLPLRPQDARACVTDSRGAPPGASSLPSPFGRSRPGVHSSCVASVTAGSELPSIQPPRCPPRSLLLHVAQASSQPFPAPVLRREVGRRPPGGPLPPPTLASVPHREALWPSGVHSRSPLLPCDPSLPRTRHGGPGLGSESRAGSGGTLDFAAWR